MALGAPPSARREDSSKPVAISPQASLWVAMPDDTMPFSHSSCLALVSETPKVSSAPTTLPSKTPSGADTGTLSDEVL